MKKKICCIFNLAPHYNESIYKLMDIELKCDFYIGDRVSYSIKLMDYNNLKGFKKKIIYQPIFGNFYWQKGAFQLVFKNYEYYIITGEPYCISTWLILLVNRVAGKKTYLWTHGWYGNESQIKKVIKKIFFGLADTILLYGNYAKKLMLKEGFNQNKLIPIYNSMDFDTQFKIRNKLMKTLVYIDFFQNDFPVLLYVGRIQNRKKIDLLIEAIYKLKQNNLFFNLIIIGNDSKEINLNKLVSNYNLEKNIWFFGPCYDENVLGELIYNADLCVVPGDIGLTVMHSFVYGTPVVTHNNFTKHGPEFEAISPKETGDFFIEDSIEDLCSKIKEWTILKELNRKIIRENCYKVVDEIYNSNNQINILSKIFK